MPDYRCYFPNDHRHIVGVETLTECKNDAEARRLAMTLASQRFSAAVLRGEEVAMSLLVPLRLTRVGPRAARAAPAVASFETDSSPPSVAKHAAYEVGGVPGAQLVHHVGPVELDGAWADAEHPRRFLARGTPHNLR